MPRPFQPSDLEALLEINNANAPAVNILSRAEMEKLLDLSRWTMVVDDTEGPAGFLLGLHGPGVPYPSENYRWFSDEYEEFLYVDRVAVAERAQGRGLGTRLYHAFIDHARKVGIDTVCAEVNLRPPNPGSIRFHERFGFNSLGEQETKGNTVRVRLYAYDVSASQDPGPRTRGMGHRERGTGNGERGRGAGPMTDD